MKCQSECGSFTLKINKDGSYEVLGITTAEFSAMFPNFSVSTDQNNHFVLNNFYNSLSDGGDGDRQMVLDANIDGAIYPTPCEIDQITSWIYADGTIIARVVDEEAILDDDYPTLSEVVATTNEDIRVVNSPLSTEYISQIRNAIDGSSLPVLEELNINLEDSSSIDTDTLTAYLNIIFELGIKNRTIIPNLETSSRTPIFYILDNVAYLHLYPYNFKGDAATDICLYVKKITDAIRNANITVDTIINLHDYHAPQQFNEAVIGDVEPPRNTLKALISLRECGFIADHHTTLITPYGKFKNSYWEFFRTFHYYDNSLGQTVALEGTYRPEYEAAIVAVVSQLTYSMVWVGTDILDVISHDVMSTVKTMFNPNHMRVVDLNFFGEGIEISDDTLEMWSIYSIDSGSGGWIKRSPREAFYNFVSGGREATVIWDNPDGTVTQKDYIALDGISKIANAKYMIELDSDRYRLTPSVIIAPLKSRVELGNIPIDGIEIRLFDRGTNYYADMQTVMHFISEGASVVQYIMRETNAIATVTADNISTSSGYLVDDMTIFDTHDNADTSLIDGVLMIKRITHMEAIENIVAVRDITIIDLRLLSANDAIVLMKFLGSTATYRVTVAQTQSEWLEILKLLYGLNFTIVCVDGEIADVLSGSMSKDPSVYYRFGVIGNNIVKTPTDAVYRIGTPPYVIGTRYIEYLEYIRDNITSGYSSYFRYFLDNAIPLDDGIYYINAKISGEVVATPEHTVDDDTHNDQNVNFSLNDISISLDDKSLFDACVDPLPTNVLYKIARIDIANLEYTIDSLSTIKAGWYATSTRCPTDGCINVSEGIGTIESQDFGEPHVTYSFVTNPDESVTITYNAYDADGNDITDDFATVSLFDKFIHKDIDGGNNG